jgi:phage gp37-like protein
MTSLGRNISILLAVVVALCYTTVSAQSDLCAGATPITCGQTITGNTTGNGGDLLAIGCGTNNSPGVWFSFTGDGSSATASLCGSSFDTYITVVSGTCAAPVCVANNDDFCGLQSEVSFPTTIGVTYYINVHGYGTASGAYTLSLTCIIPTSNDICSGAIPLSCGSSVAGTTVGATPDALPGGCLTPVNAPGVWYSFIGTGQNVQFSLCGSAFDTRIAVLSGTCGGLICQALNDDFCGLQSQVTLAAFLGVTYYIYVTGFGTSSGNFTLNVSCLVPLANETCANAINIACGQTITGITAGGTPDALPGGCLTPNNAPGVWYSFIGTGQNVQFSLCGSAFDTRIAILSGTCSSLTCVVTNDDFCGAQSQASIFAAAGVTYYIYVTGFGTASGNFTLNVTCTNPPPNETCSGAIPITCGQTITGTTSGASTDAIPLGCAINNNAPAIWYRFTGSGGPMTISLCGSSFNTQLSLFTGTCGSLNCYWYNDDACGTQSQIALPNTISGLSYYVYVYGLNGASGNFTLSLTCPPPPPPSCYSLQTNPCPSINLGADIAIPSCTDPCTPITITPTVPAINATTSYTVCGIPYIPYPYNTGTGFSIGVDDVYTGIINLPFNFCFFGTNYTQCKVGSNGLMTFNLAAGPFCPWAFTATCPNALLPINSIFGVYHDIDPAILCGATPCGDARYATFGTAPCRVFVVSWDNLPHFTGTCNPLRTTCEIVLYETSNVIEVFVEGKPTCTTWNSGNALIGIQNNTGTIGYTPPNRNTGPWTAAYEGWRFTPAGASTSTVTWQQQGTPLGTGNTINVCPSQATQTYAATVTYNLCNGTQLQYFDDIIITCAMIMLPVEWLSFDVTSKPDASEVMCNWKVASEQGNHYFTIQRSQDAEKWEDIGIVESQGDTHTERSYAYTDKSPKNGLSYYRIRQTDFNGEEDHSEIRSVVFDSQYTQHRIFPNPTSDLITITPWNSDTKIKLIDPTGKTIEAPMLESGTFDLRQILPGAYFVEISDSANAHTERIKIIVE